MVFLDARQMPWLRRAGGHEVKDMNACPHQWINPEDPQIGRLPYSPVIGPRRREMKPGTTYRCQRCGETLTIPADEAGIEEKAGSWADYPHINRGWHEYLTNQREQ